MSRAAVLALALLAACQSEATQMILHVDADEAVQARAQSIRVRVIGESGEELASQNVVLRGPDAEAGFPFEQPIHPRDGDVTRPYHLVFELFDAGDPAGEGARPFARERAIGRYVDGERQHVWLRFTASCADFLDCGETETCLGGACAPACVSGDAQLDARPETGRTPPETCANSDAWVLSDWPDDWPCRPGECVNEGVHLRSIGTAEDAVHVGFRAQVEASGTRVTVPAADLPTNVGAGDRIVFVGGTEREESAFILGRVSSSRLLLQSTVSRDLDAPFRIERAYRSLQAWEDEREGNLMDEGRTEVGVAYADSPFTGRLLFEGSITDPVHRFYLTVAPGQRHRGRAGRGVELAHRFSIATGPDRGELIHEGAIDVRVPYTHVEWFEIQGWSANNQEHEQNDGYHGVVVRSTGVELEHLLVHSDGAARTLESAADGIHIRGEDIVVSVRNSVFYDIARSAIVLRDARMSRLEVDHVSVLDCMRGAYTPILGCVGAHGGQGNELMIRNSIAHASQRLGCAIEREGGFQRGAFFVSSWGRDAPGALATVDPASGNNLSTDRSAVGADPMWLDRPRGSDESDCSQGESDVDAGDPRAIFMRVTQGSEDLHLAEGSPAIGAGTNLLGEVEGVDIDGESRPAAGVWDVGADQRRAP
ncbi:MAG: hypothetical protein AAF411_08200 [Myxococcota bacterium]